MVAHSLQKSRVRVDEGRGRLAEHHAVDRLDVVEPTGRRRASSSSTARPPAGTCTRTPIVESTEPWAIAFRAEEAMLGVAPGALGALELFHSDRPVLDARMSRRRDVGEEIAPSLVVEDGAETGVVERGVADLAAVQMEVLVEEQAEIAGCGRCRSAPRSRGHRRSRGSRRRRARAARRRAGGGSGSRRSRACRARSRSAAPTPDCRPRRAPVSEHAEAARMADGVVLLAEIWEIDVAQTIVGVEHHLQRAVADDEVARHVRGVVCCWCGYPLLGSSGVAMTPCLPFVIGVGSPATIAWAMHAAASGERLRVMLYRASRLMPQAAK